MPTYKATKSRSKSSSQSREGWCVIFRHPVRKDNSGKALRIRRGLSTKDEQEADRLIEQLNKLLQDESYWTIAARERASREGLDPLVVAIFYDDMTPQLHNPTESRDEIIPLPGNQDGYARVQFIGQTGTGKTTLLRQLIGSDPKRDRFPSTATAKTTTCEIEIVLSPEPVYKGVVSFLPEVVVRNYVKECVIAATVASAGDAPKSEVMRRLLEHVEQRFRLSYILGKVSEADEDNDEDMDDGEESDDALMSPEIDPEEQARLQQKLNDYFDWITVLGKAEKASVIQELDLKESETLRPEDDDTVQDLLEENLQFDEEVERLVDGIMDDIQERFQLLDQANLQRGKSDWPTRWILEVEDRAVFIRSINGFTSNYAPNFGKLLTPLVEGLRVRGPFRPEWHQDNDIPKLVLIDGEGLGHTPESASSISTSVTRRYEQSDVILLVDTAEQPMQAATLAVLRSVCSGGHQSKLAIVFTHLDQVKGDNVRSHKDKEEHVQKSLDNAISALKDALGATIAKSLKRSLEDKVFFVSKIQDALAEKLAATRKQLAQLLEVLQKPARLQDTQGCIPVYDVANLALAIRAAMDEFHQVWKVRLGFGNAPSMYPEHWSRVKALSRRIAILHEDEYDTLKPVADLIRLLSDHLTPFIASPRAWKGTSPEDVRTAAVDKIRQEVYSQLHSLSFNRICLNCLHEWDIAFQRRGRGSTRVRAQDIRNIYERAAPIPGETPVQESVQLLDEVRAVFKEAASTVNAELI